MEELRRTSVSVEARLQFETLISDLVSHFVSLEPPEVDLAVRDAQRQVVLALDLDRSGLFEIEEDGAFWLTHSWARPEYTPLPDRLDASGLFPMLSGRLKTASHLCLTSADDLPAGTDRASFERFGTKSTVVVPLRVADHLVGALTFGTLRAERTWAPEIVDRLVVIGQVFAHALARKRADQELRRALAENARLRGQLEEENLYLQQEVRELQGTSPVMGQSTAVRRVLDLVAQVAPSNATVLLLGETGTGKELIANAVHERSPRAGRTMVRVNCSAIPVALIESELFGREKGAYTGALARQAGRFELADRSTIFLDEIGELPLDVQVKLLRVLQERSFERLGSASPITVDVRVVAATNRDLGRAVAQGAFREDLYYRLNVFPITVPPLRERPEDIPALVWAFVDEFARGLGKRIESISREQMAALQRHSWPGNVRELRNVVERAVIVSPGPRLLIEPPRPSETLEPRSVRLEDVEREHIRAVLERAGWRVRGAGGAAQLLDLKPSTLEGRMAKLGLTRPPR